jgi:long-chain acyl-CoA synthetase
VVLDDEGNLLPPYEVGLLGIKSPTITPGYWNDSNRTLKSFKQGYWTTGDLVYYDKEHKFYHVDRSVDAIECASGSVNSLPIEELILKHNDDVADCTVIGIPNENGTSSIVTFIKLKPKRTTKASMLLDAINKQLLENDYEQLSFLSLVKEFPVGSTGKVLKRQLREQYKDLLILVDNDLKSDRIDDFAYARLNQRENLALSGFAQ